MPDVLRPDLDKRESYAREVERRQILNEDPRFPGVCRRCRLREDDPADDEPCAGAAPTPQASHDV